MSNEVSVPVALGFDFGTQSVRAVLIDAKGHQCGVGSDDFRHAQLTRALPGTSEPLPHRYALQSPSNWIEGASIATGEAISKSRIDVGRGGSFLRRYGGTIGLEWLFPKLLKTIELGAERYRHSRLFVGGRRLVRLEAGRACRATLAAIDLPSGLQSAAVSGIRLRFARLLASRASRVGRSDSIENARSRQ